MKWFKVFPSLIKGKDVLPVGGIQLFLLGSRKVSLVHSTQGLYAIDDACPHQGAPLSKGKINHRNEIICPLHSYCFSLEFGNECEQKTQDMITHPVVEKEDGLYIGVHEKYNT
ncbi:Rieske (2Fe-2S) protein [Xanthovirga aplysinae]|uniref:Rieske (2Fe-2S) protein n=1 Tax=Xanthovirga aplysinae TaxID=2529853 RepID=UPI0012BD48B4|nr:Rieske (2Fe-2S) protein [Xanthovirga aplysinae]MTI33545.1 Rieske (2Fe-2S) protein [Xanthovirga aplysinae]